MYCLITLIQSIPIERDSTMTAQATGKGKKKKNPKISVAAALSWFFAILANKNRKIMKIFGKLDHLKNWWVLCKR